jgi:hypothetical protein
MAKRTINSIKLYNLAGWRSIDCTSYDVLISDKKNTTIHDGIFSVRTTNHPTNSRFAILQTINIHKLLDFIRRDDRRTSTPTAL